MAMASAGGPTVRVTGFNSGISVFLIQSVLAGQVSGSWWSHSGPYHHRSVSRSSLDPTPREARSAGLQFVGTYLHDWVGSC